MITTTCEKALQGIFQVHISRHASNKSNSDDDNEFFDDVALHHDLVNVETVDLLDVSIKIYLMQTPVLSVSGSVCLRQVQQSNIRRICSTS